MVKNLQQLQNEATERLLTLMNEDTGKDTMHDGNFRLKMADFLKTELETIVKESFKNTRVEEENKTNVRALSMEWLIDGYNQALSDKHNKECEFLGN